MIYHYTSADDDHLGSILREGVLRPTESNLDAAVEHAGPDVVWCLFGEYVSGEGHGLVNAGHDFKTHVRFSLDVEGEPWLDWAKRHRMPSRFQKGLIRSGGGLGMARRWRVVEGPVPRDAWRSIFYAPTGEEIPVGATEIPGSVRHDHRLRIVRW